MTALIAPSSPSRRALLAGSGIAVADALSLATNPEIASNPDAELISFCTQFEAAGEPRFVSDGENSRANFCRHSRPRSGYDRKQS